MDTLKLVKILIVDDDDDFRALLKELLNQHGANVVEAKNGQEALKQLETSSFSLILTDTNMPVMDGIDLLVELRKRDCTTPIIIFFSGCRNCEITKDELRKLGPQFILSKIDKISRWIGACLSATTKPRY